MDYKILIAITGLLLTIISAIISFLKIKKQKTEEELLIDELLKKERAYTLKLKKIERDIHLINSLDLNLNIEYEDRRREIFEKLLLNILKKYSDGKYKEVKDAYIMDNNKKNINYLDKLQKEYEQKMAAHNIRYDGITPSS